MFYLSSLAIRAELDDGFIIRTRKKNVKGDGAQLKGLISWLLLVKIQNSFLGDTKAAFVVLSFSCSSC